MINIGPKEDGTVPQPSVDIMNFIGNWMQANSESVYGTSGNPFNDNFPWGYATHKDNIIYLHLLREPLNRRIILKGLLSPVEKAEILSSGMAVPVSDKGHYALTIPAELDYGQIPVVKLVCKAPVRFSEDNYMNENIVSIPVANGKIIPGKEGSLSIAEGGNTQNFHAGTGKLQLKCEIDEPGVYKVRIFTSRHWRRTFAEGAKITLKVDDNPSFNSVLMQKDGELANVRQNSYPETWSDVGTVNFRQKGTKELELAVNSTGTFSRLGFFGEDIQNESENNIRFMRIELIKETR